MTTTMTTNREDTAMSGPLPEVTWRSIERSPGVTRQIVRVRMRAALAETLPYMMADRSDRTGEEVVPDPTAFDRLAWALTIERWLDAWGA